MVQPPRTWGGAGFILFLSNSHSIQFSLGCGNSTNTKSELLALWAILSVSKNLGIPLHSIFGDSLVIITWASGKGSLNLPHLIHWCDDLKNLLQHFPDLIMNHIYREHNMIADSLSKFALSLDAGHGKFQEFCDDKIADQGDFRLF